LSHRGKFGIFGYEKPSNKALHKGKFAYISPFRRTLKVPFPIANAGLGTFLVVVLTLRFLSTHGF
jgi:hypothetical protein